MVIGSGTQRVPPVSSTRTGGGGGWWCGDRRQTLTCIKKAVELDQSIGLYIGRKQHKNTQKPTHQQFNHAWQWAHAEKREKC